MSQINGFKADSYSKRTLSNDTSYKFGKTVQIGCRQLTYSGSFLPSKLPPISSFTNIGGSFSRLGVAPYFSLTPRIFTDIISIFALIIHFFTVILSSFTP
jgi:hypothetical protein